MGLYEFAFSPHSTGVSDAFLTNFRRLEEDDAGAGDVPAPKLSDSDILKDTFMIYGTILVVCFLLFCFVRQKFPRPYSIRNWVEKVKSPLAAEKYGFFSWIWNMNAATDEDILEECGMDSLCYLRILGMGYKICCVGALNGIWLLPMYKYAHSDAETAKITDPIEQLTVANVAAGSSMLVGTVIASYIFFGYVMYLILKEFKWFTEYRHKYLGKQKPRNYSIYVRNIPLEHRSNAGLEEFFKRCFSEDKILEAKLRINAPQLMKLVATRRTTVSKLKHALAHEDIFRTPFMIKPNLFGGEKVRAIPYLANVLNDANADISLRIEEIETQFSDQSNFAVLDDPAEVNQNRDKLHRVDETDVNDIETMMDSEKVVGDTQSMEGESSRQGLLQNTFGRGVKAVASQRKVLASGASLVTSGATSIGKNAVGLLKGFKEGEFFDSGFVSFADLGTTNAALQMIHHETPFAIEVQNAPDPEDIFWNNVGRSHKDLELGNLFSQCGTAAVCLFWTIPMASITALSSISGLKKIKFINDIIEEVPVLEPILLQLAPLMVIVLNSLLPMILTIFAMKEGPISTSVVEVSLFTKLAAFTIIQTFFVSFLGKALLEDVKTISQDPMKLIDLLATELPPRSTFFIQIVFVSNAISLILEILQVIPIVMSLIRKCISPKLTEEERQTTVFGIRPLEDPSEFGQAANLAGVVLMFMVTLVYAVIAPLTSFILGFSYAFMYVCYKHQFFYIYPTSPDSGGKIWTSFIKIMMTCMLISQVTIAALMGLKKSPIAVPLIVPLIVVTILFNGYISKQHFRVSAFLPSGECLKIDRQNGPDFDLNFVSDAYLQDELRTKNETIEVTPMQTIALEQQGIFLDSQKTA